jgi:hypothetical protein
MSSLPPFELDGLDQAISFYREVVGSSVALKSTSG